MPARRVRRAAPRRGVAVGARRRLPAVRRGARHVRVGLRRRSRESRVARRGHERCLRRRRHRAENPPRPAARRLHGGVPTQAADGGAALQHAREGDRQPGRRTDWRGRRGTTTMTTRLVTSGLLLLLLTSTAFAQSPSPNFTGVFADSLKLLAVEHGVRIVAQEKTRRELGGPFVPDYRRSVHIPTAWE